MDEYAAKLVLDLGDETEAEYDLPSTRPFTIGRRPENDLVLDEPFVSRLHCVLESSGRGWEIRRTSEKNGIKVNGRPVRRALLRHGDQLAICSHRFTFRLALPEQAAAPRTRETESTECYALQADFAASEDDHANGGEIRSSLPLEDVTGPAVVSAPRTVPVLAACEDSGTEILAVHGQAEAPAARPAPTARPKDDGTEFIDMSGVVNARRARGRELEQWKRMIAEEKPGGKKRVTPVGILLVLTAAAVVWLFAGLMHSSTETAVTAETEEVQAGRSALYETRVYGAGITNRLAARNVVHEDERVRVRYVIPGSRPAVLLVTGKIEGESRFTLQFESGDTKVVTIRVVEPKPDRDAEADDPSLTPKDRVERARQEIAFGDTFREAKQEARNEESYYRTFHHYRRAVRFLDIVLPDLDEEFTRTRNLARERLNGAETEWKAVYDRLRWVELVETYSKRKDGPGALRVLERILRLVQDRRDERYLEAQVLHDYISREVGGAGS